MKNHVSITRRAHGEILGYLMILRDLHGWDDDPSLHKLIDMLELKKREGLAPVQRSGAA